MKRYAKFGYAAPLRFRVILEKPQGGGQNDPPPPTRAKARTLQPVSVSDLGASLPTGYPGDPHRRPASVRRAGAAARRPGPLRQSGGAQSGARRPRLPRVGGRRPAALRRPRRVRSAISVPGPEGGL